MSYYDTVIQLPRSTRRRDWYELWHTLRRWGTVRQWREDGDLTPFYQQRADAAARVYERATPDGFVYFYQWGRDCDMCEADSVRKRAAVPMAIEHEIDQIYEWAEGPTRTAILTADEAADYEPHSRDRVMEAFENGQGANAYSV